MSISAFKAQFDGGVRATSYEVTINFPAAVVAGTAARKATYLAKGAQLPDDTVNLIDIYFQGRQVKVAGDRTFTDLTITFYLDKEFALRDAFERWMGLLNGHNSNLGIANPNLYKADIFVTVKDRDGRSLKTYHYVGCIPNNIATIDLGYDQTDTIIEFPISFGYDYWETETTK